MTAGARCADRRCADGRCGACCGAHLAGDLIRDRPEHDLQPLLGRAQDTSCSQAPERRFIDRTVVHQHQPEPRRAGGDLREVPCTAERLDKGGAARGGRARQRRMFHRLIGIAPGSGKIQAHDANAKYRVVKGEVRAADGQEEERMLRMAEVEHVIEQPG